MKDLALFAFASGEFVSLLVLGLFQLVWYCSLWGHLIALKRRVDHHNRRALQIAELAGSSARLVEELGEELAELRRSIAAPAVPLAPAPVLNPCPCEECGGPLEEDGPSVATVCPACHGRPFVVECRCRETFVGDWREAAAAGWVTSDESRTGSGRFVNWLGICPRCL
jgi:hypothetical protein